MSLLQLWYPETILLTLLRALKNILHLILILKCDLEYLKTVNSMTRYCHQTPVYHGNSVFGNTVADICILKKIIKFNNEFI